jgi:hypothetical protein
MEKNAIIVFSIPIIISGLLLFDDDESWFSKIGILDIFIIIGFFGFLAISAFIVYKTYPRVLEAIKPDNV